MPDENVHPTATGLAKKTVDSHQDPQDIVFWSAWVSLHGLKYGTAWLTTVLSFQSGMTASPGIVTMLNFSASGWPLKNATSLIYITKLMWVFLLPEVVMANAEGQPYKKEKEFLEVNPLGLVPSLEHKGVGSLYESDVLVEYLEDLYPDSPEHP
jgi:glutathione S-transferase